MVVRSAAFRVMAVAALTAFFSTANAAVYPPQQQLPQQVIVDFNNLPSTLLQQFPSGDVQLTSRVRDLGASDPSTMPHLVGLLKNPAITPDQFKAIMLGLVQLARLASRTDQAYANEIQQAIAATNDPKIIQAYQQIVGDVAIAATGGGGGGGSGTGGATGGGSGSGGSGGAASQFGGLHFTTTGSTLGTGGSANSTNSTSTSPH